MEKYIRKLVAEKDSIRRVNLSRLYLSKVPEELRDCRQLEEVILAENEIKTFPAWLFDLPALKKLNISFNCNKVIPPALARAQKLEKLVISAPADKTLPEAVLQLPQLKILHIAGALSGLPDGLFNLGQLQEIGLFANELTTLPEGITRLPKLKKIYFKQYWFSEQLVHINTEDVFDKLSRCPALRVLDLMTAAGLIRPDSEGIGKLTQLRELYLQQNGLTAIPAGIFKLVNLQTLDLGINHIRSVPKDIARLTRLTKLCLNSNHTPPLDTRHLWQQIAVFEQLETLALWSCQAKMEIPEEIAALKKLKSLDVDNNKITKLPESLATMVWLQKLRISTNPLPENEAERLQAALPHTKVMG